MLGAIIGDSDTLAAITGGIAEAHYGIDKEFEDEALKFLDGELRGIYDECKAFIGTITAPQTTA